MKRAFFLLGFAALALFSLTTPRAFAQDSAAPYIGYTKTIPLHGATSHGAHAASAMSAATTGNSTVPLWNYTVTSPLDSKTYTGSMVGASPFYNGLRTTNVATVVVPLIIKMPDGSTFDPTVANKCATWGSPMTQVMASPIFQPASYTMNSISMGTGQYTDIFQRANFYDTNVSVTGQSYHTVLSPVTTAPAQTVTLQQGQGQSWLFGNCGLTGVMDLSTFDSIVTSQVIPSLMSNGLLTPTSFVVFVLHNVVMGDPGTSVSSNCCVIGYHSAFGYSAGTQTYAVADFDDSRVFQNPDVQPLSHEVGEWLNDPFGTNLTPSWGHVGQVVQCQNNLEVGDPFAGVPPTAYQIPGQIGVTMPNGQTFFPQALAYFSWFYRQTPSLGAGGQYSDIGTNAFQSLLCN